MVMGAADVLAGREKRSFLKLRSMVSRFRPPVAKRELPEARAPGDRTLSASGSKVLRKLLVEKLLLKLRLVLPFKLPRKLPPPPRKLPPDPLGVLVALLGDP